MWYSVKEIAREQGNKSRLSIEDFSLFFCQARVLGKDLSEAFVAALAEVVFSQMRNSTQMIER